MRDLMIIGGLAGLAIARLMMGWNKHMQDGTAGAPGWTLLMGMGIGVGLGAVIAILINAVEKKPLT